MYLKGQPSYYRWMLFLQCFSLIAWLSLLPIGSGLDFLTSYPVENTVLEICVVVPIMAILFLDSTQHLVFNLSS